MCVDHIQSRAVGIWMAVPVAATPTRSNMAWVYGLISLRWGNGCLVFDVWGAVVFGRGTRRFRQAPSRTGSLHFIMTFAENCRPQQRIMVLSQYNMVGSVHTLFCKKRSITSI